MTSGTWFDSLFLNKGALHSHSHAVKVEYNLILTVLTPGGAGRRIANPFLEKECRFDSCHCLIHPVMIKYYYWLVSLMVKQRAVNSSSEVRFLYRPTFSKESFQRKLEASKDGCFYSWTVSVMLTRPKVNFMGDLG